MGLSSHYNICPSNLKYQMKKNWLKESVLHEQQELSHMQHMSHLQQYVYFFVY